MIEIGWALALLALVALLIGLAEQARWFVLWGLTLGCVAFWVFVAAGFSGLLNS